MPTLRIVFALPFLLGCLTTHALMAQENSGGPTDPKARKTYEKALKYVHERNSLSAFDEFKKADKQDAGHCLDCQIKMIGYSIQFAEWKTAELAAAEMLAEAKSNREIALAHYQFAFVLVEEGLQKRKEELFARAHEESSKALATIANFPDALWVDGIALAHLGKDDAAKTSFEQYVKMRPADDAQRQRALRFISRPELVRAKMAPPFAINTTDGQRLSLDGLQGKVVLVDFWATWCEPCREALPHIREIAKKFQGQPLIVLSVSLDDDEQKWKDFVSKHEMAWPQYRDGGFTGPIATLFAVHAIPHTFTIDADGILQEEHIGDASVEGKLKKLIARARELQPTEAIVK